MAIYTLRGDCGSIRAALRIIGGRVYSVDQSYQAYGAVSAMGAVRLTVASSEAASPPPDPDGCHTIRALGDGVRFGVSAPALGRPHGASPTTDQIDHLADLSPSLRRGENGPLGKAASSVILQRSASTRGETIVGNNINSDPLSDTE